MASQLKVKLLRSVFGRLPRHRATLRGLGLRRIGQTVILTDHPCIRGMLSQVDYLVKVESLS